MLIPDLIVLDELRDALTTGDTDDFLEYDLPSRRFLPATPWLYLCVTGL